MKRYIFTFHMLKERMRRKGISVDDLARACGISTWALGEKLRGHFDFKASEIMVIAETLDIPDKQIPAYFFHKQFEFLKLTERRQIDDGTTEKPCQSNPGKVP